MEIVLSKKFGKDIASHIMPYVWYNRKIARHKYNKLLHKELLEMTTMIRKMSDHYIHKGKRPDFAQKKLSYPENWCHDEEEEKGKYLYEWYAYSFAKSKCGLWTISTYNGGSPTRVLNPEWEGKLAANHQILSERERRRILKRKYYLLKYGKKRDAKCLIC